MLSGDMPSASPPENRKAISKSCRKPNGTKEARKRSIDVKIFPIFQQSSNHPKNGGWITLSFDQATGKSAYGIHIAIYLMKLAKRVEKDSLSRRKKASPMLAPHHPTSALNKDSLRKQMEHTRSKDNDHHQALITKMARGSEEALSEFYRIFEKKIYAFVQIRLNDSHDATDLLNEIMWEVWKGAARFEGRSAVTSWVFGIAHHKIVDRIRSKTRHPTEQLETIESYESDLDLETLVGKRQLGSHIQHCMEKLSHEQRQVVHFAFFEDFSYREISEIVGSPEGTIKARMFHAKQALKRCLARRLKAD